MEKKMKYNVIVMKRTQDHIIVIETENFDEAMKSWEELKNKWIESVKETKPFELLQPLVTAFDPGAIYEIAIIPVESAINVNSNNPYKRNMQANGFSNTFSNPVLDQGYQR